MAIDPYSPEEIRRILVEAGLVGANAEAVAVAVNQAMDRTKDRLVDQLLLDVRGPVRPEVMERAVAQAERQTRRIYGQLSQTHLKSIAETMRQGIEEGLHPDAIARRLDQIKGLDPQRAARYDKYRRYLELSDLSDEEVERRAERFFQKELRDRRKVIARTEQRFATSEGSELLAKSRDQRFKRWLTAGDSRVSDIDVQNEAAGWIDIDEAFPSGHMTPPSHPNCRCVVTYRTNPPTELERQRAREQSERTMEAIA